MNEAPLDPHPLSAAGESRRAAILDLARRAACRRRQRRRATRAATAVATAAAAIAVTVGVISRRPADPAPVAIPVEAPVEIPPTRLPATTQTSPPPRASRRAPAVADRTPAVTIVRLPTESGIVERLALPPRAGTGVRRLSDEELLEHLAHAGRPAGLAYLDGDKAPVVLFRDGRP